MEESKVCDVLVKLYAEQLGLAKHHEQMVNANAGTAFVLFTILMAIIAPKPELFEHIYLPLLFRVILEAGSLAVLIGRVHHSFQASECYVKSNHLLARILAITGDIVGQSDLTERPRKHEFESRGARLLAYWVSLQSSTAISAALLTIGVLMVLLIH